MDSKSTVTTQGKDLPIGVDSATKTSAHYNGKDPLDHPTHLPTNTELFPKVITAFQSTLVPTAPIIYCMTLLGYTIKGDAREYKESSRGGFSLLCSK